MATDQSWRRFLDAGALIGQVSMARAEEISRGLFSDDEARRQESWRDLEELGRVGRKMGEQFVALARAELAKQLEGVGGFEQLVDRLADLFATAGPSEDERPAPGDRTAFADLLDAPAPPAAAPKEPKNKDGAEEKKAKAKGQASGEKAKGGKKRKKKEKASAPAGGAEGTKLLTLTRPDASASP
ncbi:MAG: hypothetical protein ACRDYB_03640 [Acidimicrobiales bacterium]